MADAAATLTERDLEQLEAAFLADEIRALEADLATLRAIRGTLMGGPPAGWDAWIMALPDEVFADLLGDADDRCRHPAPTRPSPTAITRPGPDWSRVGRYPPSPKHNVDPGQAALLTEQLGPLYGAAIRWGVAR
jgi:hypothetical protein